MMEIGRFALTLSVHVVVSCTQYHLILCVTSEFVVCPYHVCLRFGAFNDNVV